VQQADRRTAHSRHAQARSISCKGTAGTHGDGLAETKPSAAARKALEGPRADCFKLLKVLPKVAAQHMCLR
jgi:hypothetical protein